MLGQVFNNGNNDSNVFWLFLHATLGIEYFGFFKALVMSTKSKLDTVVARVRR